MQILLMSATFFLKPVLQNNKLQKNFRTFRKTRLVLGSGQLNFKERWGDNYGIHRNA